MKILLIYPYCPDERPHGEDAGVAPIGIYYVGALLKEKHYDVEILNWHDMRDQKGQIYDILKRKQPDVIGFSILHANRWGGVDIARIAKRVRPGVKIVFGGIGATNLWRHFLTHFQEIDVVVLGEGEYAFLDLVRCFKKKDAAAVASVRGIAFRKKGKPVASKPRDPIAELDDLPNPAMHFTYRHVALTRGCPGRCTFCGSPEFWGTRVRFHSVDYFADQLHMLYKKGVTFFFVSDDTFTLKKKKVIEICQQIVHRRLNIAWAAISRVDTVSEEVLYWMRKAGCIQISYGVESGSEINRRFLNKRITETQIQRAFDLTQRYGIMARAYFIYGCPGETLKTIRETLDLIDSIQPLGALFYILDIFPGTTLYEGYKKRAQVTDDVWLNRIEDVMYYETDAALTSGQILSFGKTLRHHFYSHLPGYAEGVELIDKKELYPLHADFYSRLAMTFDQGEYAEIGAIPGKSDIAEKLYRKALEYHEDPRAYLGLGILAQKRQDYDASIITLTEGVACFPKDLQLNICLAVSHMNMGAFEHALERLLNFEQSSQTWHFIAGCYQAMGDTEKAAVYATRLETIAKQPDAV